MGMRYLTKKLTPYNVHKAEKMYNMDFADFFNIGNMSITRMAMIIQTGNNLCDMETACKILENYLEEHTIVEAIIQLFDEADRDFGLLKSGGLTIEDVRAELYKNANIEKISEEKNTDLKDNETPKVDVNGFVSVD